MGTDVVPLLKHGFRQEVDKVGVNSRNSVVLKDRLCGLVQSCAAVKLKFCVDIRFLQSYVQVVVFWIRRTIKVSVLELILDLTQNFVHLVFLTFLIFL